MQYNAHSYDNVWTKNVLKIDNVFKIKKGNNVCYPRMFDNVSTFFFYLTMSTSLTFFSLTMYERQCTIYIKNYHGNKITKR